LIELYFMVTWCAFMSSRISIARYRGILALLLAAEGVLGGGTEARSEKRFSNF
jgi:hypothetical protein